MSNEQVTRQTEEIKADLRNVSSTRDVRSYDDNSIAVTFESGKEVSQAFSNGMLERGYVAATTEIVEVSPDIIMGHTRDDDTMECIRVVYKRMTAI
ncbi:hypothetical protein OSG_eHP22_00175 [environmental Halophage eHP-22]|nr:hypothetical protein OSG_eHP22_00175 [environmental Halophage eHP-22]